MSAPENQSSPSPVPPVGAVELPAARSWLRLAEPAGFLVTAGIFLVVLMGGLDSFVVSTALPTIASDLHQVNGVAFVVSAYLVSATIAVPVFGRLSDIASRRNVFLAGTAIFIVGSVLAGFSQSLTELIIFRGLQGFGGGATFPVAIAMIAALFGPEDRTRAIGMLGATAGISIVAGPLLGSYIVSVTTWRWVFYINLPFGLFAVLILVLWVDPLRSVTRGRFDLPGAALISGWVSALMVALVGVSDLGWAWTDDRVIGLLFTTVGLLAAFLWWELRYAQPLLPLRLLGRRAILSANGILLFTGLLLSAVITFLSLFVGVALGGSSSDVRDMIYFFAVPMIAGANVAGALLNRCSYRTLLVPALFVSGVAGLSLSLMTTSTPLWGLSLDVLPTGGVALPLIPLGFGLGIALAGATIAIQNEAPPHQVGAAVGLTKFFQTLGGALGVSLLTMFQSWRFHSLSAGAASSGALRAALVTSYDQVFLILGVSVLLALVCSFWLRGRVPASRTESLPEGRTAAESPT